MWRFYTKNDDFVLMKWWMYNNKGPFRLQVHTQAPNHNLVFKLISFDMPACFVQSAHGWPISDCTCQCSCLLGVYMPAIDRPLSWLHVYTCRRLIGLSLIAGTAEGLKAILVLRRGATFHCFSLFHHHFVTFSPSFCHFSRHILSLFPSFSLRRADDDADNEPLPAAGRNHGFYIKMMKFVLKMMNFAWKWWILY